MSTTYSKKPFTLLLGLCLSLGMVGATAPARAQEAPPAKQAPAKQDPAKIRDLFGAGITNVIDSLHAKGSDVVPAGPVEVAPIKDNAFLIRHPGMTVISRGGQHSCTLGAILVTLIPPESGQKTWRFSMKLPESMECQNAKKQQIAMVSLGEQAISGIWQEDLQSATLLDVRLDRIRITSFDPSRWFDKRDGETTIGRISLQQELKETAPGLWAGPSAFTLENFTLSKIDTDEQVLIGKITVSVQENGLSQSMMQTLRERSEALEEAARDRETATPQGDGAAEQTESLSVEQLTALYNMVADALMNTSKGGTVSIKIENAFSTVVEQSAQVKHSYGLKSLELGYGISELDQPRANGTLWLTMDGLSHSPPGWDEVLFTPTHIRSAFRMDDLPHRTLVDLGRSILKRSRKDPASIDLHMMEGMMAVPAFLSEAGTSLTLTSASFGNDTYYVGMTGKATVDMTAVNSVRGGLIVTAYGLDDMMGILNGKLIKEGRESTLGPTLRNNLKELFALQSMGREKKDETGKPFRLYHLALTKSGKILLNDVDIQPIIEQIKTQSPQAKAKGKT